MNKCPLYMRHTVFLVQHMCQTISRPEHTCTWQIYRPGKNFINFSMNDKLTPEKIDLCPEPGAIFLQVTEEVFLSIAFSTKN